MASAAPVPDSITDPDERDFDEVWVFENPDGPTTERWFHAYGCRRWLTVRRDTSTDTVVEIVAVTRLADRRFEIVLRNRVQFGVGAIERLPEVVAAAGGSRVFVVTDPGVRGSGVIDRVLGVLAAAGLETAVFAEVEPNPAASTVERGAAALRAFGLSGTVVVRDRRRLVDGRGQGDRPARRERPAVWDLEYDGPDLTPGRPDRRGPDDGRHRRRDEPLRGHHRRGRRAARTTSAIRRCCPSRRSSTRP